MTKKFDESLSRQALNLQEKTRSNIFPWRGQFSPELIENIIEAYCPENSVILDPFCGSGTVLCEAGLYGLEAIGIELNPAAYIFSKTYEIINLSPQEIRVTLISFKRKINIAFPEPNILSSDTTDKTLSQNKFYEVLINVRKLLSQVEQILLDVFVILLDIHKKPLTTVNIYVALNKIINAVSHFPHSENKITALIGDSRSMPLNNEVVDFIITSPPYINVFNYHQNYRRSAELLGWDILKIAKSEIGSNRANRGNRFLTVIQYCIDMLSTLFELHRVTRENGKMIFVVGYESSVLGVPFYNADIIELLAIKSNLFRQAQRQNRVFKNKFGRLIREDLLHLERNNVDCPVAINFNVAKNVASQALNQGLSIVPKKNREFLIKAIKSVEQVSGIPLYHPSGIHYYKKEVSI